MASRRSRLSVRPNLGVRSTAPKPSPTPSASDLSSKSGVDQTGKPKSQPIQVIQSPVRKDSLNSSENQDAKSEIKMEVDKSSAKIRDDLKPTRNVESPTVVDEAVTKTEVEGLENEPVIKVKSALHSDAKPAVVQEKPVLSASEPLLKDDGDHKDTLKAVVRPRSRFPRARPNVAEAGRTPRIRTTSISQGSESGDESRKVLQPVQRVPQPTAVIEVWNHTSEQPTPSQKKKEEAVPFIPPADGKTSKHVEHEKVVEKKAFDRKPPKETQVKEVRKKRKLEMLDSPVDRSKLTMRDLIYMNPSSNKMKNSADASKEFNTSFTADKVDKPNVGGVSSQEAAIPTQDAGGDKEDKGDGGGGEEDALPAPRVMIGPDGSIIINEESLVIQKPEEEDEREIVHERNDLIVTASSFRKRQCTKHWTPKETRKFYVALSTVGTDFSMMCSLFPKRNRTELKRKFKKEEKVHWELVDKAIRERQNFDLSIFDDDSSQDEAEEQESKKKRKKKEKKVDTAKKEKPAPKEKKPRKKKKPKASKYYEESDSESEGEEEPSIVDETTSPPASVTEAVEAHSSEEDDLVILDHMQSKASRVGRKPKPAQKFTIEHGVRTRRLIRQPSGNDSNPSTPFMSPRREGRERTLSGSVAPNYINLSDISNSANLRMNDFEPGQLVFVTGKEGTGGEGGSDQQVIHVYLVSPTRTSNNPAFPLPPPPRTEASQGGSEEQSQSGAESMAVHNTQIIDLDAGSVVNSSHVVAMDANHEATATHRAEEAISISSPTGQQSLPMSQMLCASRKALSMSPPYTSLPHTVGMSPPYTSTPKSNLVTPRSPPFPEVFSPQPMAVSQPTNHQIPPETQTTSETRTVREQAVSCPAQTVEANMSSEDVVEVDKKHESYKFVLMEEGQTEGEEVIVVCNDPDSSNVETDS